jgi:hypothetical protein
MSEFYAGRLFAQKERFQAIKAWRRGEAEIPAPPPAEQELAAAITLRELRDRLTKAIEENEERGWPERNDLPVVVTFRTGKTYRSEKMTALHGTSGSMYALQFDGAPGLSYMIRLHGDHVL